MLSGLLLLALRSRGSRSCQSVRGSHPRHGSALGRILRVILVACSRTHASILSLNGPVLSCSASFTAAHRYETTNSQLRVHDLLAGPDTVFHSLVKGKVLFDGVRRLGVSVLVLGEAKVRILGGPGGLGLVS